MGVLWNFFTGTQSTVTRALRLSGILEGVYRRVLSSKCVSVRQQTAKAEVDSWGNHTI